MSENTVQSQELPGAFGEVAPEPTLIDLRKPADLNLVYRSVLNGWDVPQHIRAQICDQLEPAMDFYQHAGHPRSTARLIKLANMMLLMDVSNRVDAGERKSLHPIGRKRYPEKREPRCLSRRRKTVAAGQSQHDIAQRLRDNWRKTRS